MFRLATLLLPAALLSLGACSGGDDDDDDDLGGDPVDVPSALSELLAGADDVQWDLGMYSYGADCQDDTWEVQATTYDEVALASVVGVVVEPGRGRLGAALPFEEFDGIWVLEASGDAVGVGCAGQHTLLMAVYGRTTDGLIPTPDYATGEPLESLVYGSGYAGFGSNYEFFVDLDTDEPGVSGQITIIDPFDGIGEGPSEFELDESEGSRTLVHSTGADFLDERDPSGMIIGAHITVDTEVVQAVGL